MKQLFDAQSHITPSAMSVHNSWTTPVELIPSKLQQWDTLGDSSGS